MSTSNNCLVVGATGLVGGDVAHRLRKLGNVGSDHFPVHVILSHEPVAELEQDAPDADEDDEREAAETVVEGGTRAGG